MPVERLTIRYESLFEIRVLHHYWLDDGATIFDALPAATQRERLRGYDVRKILEIAPANATSAQLEGLQAVWKTTSLGLLVGIPASVSVDDRTVFEFTLRIADPDLSLYTAYGLRVPTSVNVYEKTTRRVLRYRSDGAVYSNLTGCARATGTGKQLFLSREVPARQATDPIEAIVNDGGALVQLLADPPAAAKAVLDPVVGNAPGFATHADVPLIAAPPDVVGTPPSHGFLLPEGAPTDTFALIRIAAVRPADSDFSCTLGGVAKPTAPVFQLRFKNRRTLWRRFKGSAPETQLSEEGPHPLTFFGNPGTASKPPTRMVKLDRSGTAITNIVSEIFM